MAERKIAVDLDAVMRLDRDPAKEFRLDIADLRWTAHGLDGIGPIAPAMLDLIEIARTVHEFDRRRPKRTSGVKVKSVRMKMSLREPRRWSQAARDELSAILRIQGNADWTFDFHPRGARKSGADTMFGASGTAVKGGKTTGGARAPKAVVLFSGGLDSTSGLATLSKDAGDYQLVSYYAGNLEQQRDIASALGFDRLAQLGAVWTNRTGNGRFGGQFWYRSFLFLSLAVAVADALKASHVYQFENGPLALSVAPLDIYRITRHAHPAVHEHMERLIWLLTRRRMSVDNPFLARTKGEAADLLRSRLGAAQFRQIVSRTESCWYLKSLTIVAGPRRKKNGQPCGACVPCLIRRAALKKGEDSGAAVDFADKSSRVARNPVVRIHFDAYSDFVDRLSAKSFSVQEFLEIVPHVTKAALMDGGRITADEAFKLYRRFAQEWKETFR